MARLISLHVVDPVEDVTITDPLLERAGSFRKSSQYPGGLYGAASFLLPRDIATRPAMLRAGMEVTVRLYTEDGWALDPVYHGWVDELEQIKQGGEALTRVTLVGDYGKILMRRGIERRWADTRLTNDVWERQNTALAAERATDDRNDRIRVQTKEVQWPYGRSYQIQYTMPTGETIKRVENDYDFREEGYRSAGGAKHNNDPGGTNTFTDLTNALDQDSTTVATVTITSDDYLYFGVRELVALNLFRVEIGSTPNAVAATLAAQYWKGATDAAAATWASLTITDGTVSGGATLAVDGNIVFTPPDDWERTTVDSDSLYWIRLQPSANLTASVTIEEIEVGDTTQDWTWRLRDTTGGSNVWSVTTSGSGSQAVTLATARQTLQLQLISNVQQTPIGDGSIYGEATEVIVYSSRDHASATVGNVDIYEVALDILDLLGVDETEISANAADLDSTLTVAIKPFITQGYEMFGSILARAASYGDSSDNPVGYGLRPPWLAPDNLPRLYIESYPDLGDFDYDISVDECDLAVRLNLDDVWNYIIVKYTNRLGYKKTLTPDDQATLTDADSVSAYGKREKVITLDLANDQIALVYGERYLARHKEPTYAVTRPLRVSRLRTANGGWVHAGQIDAGKRLRIADLPNLTGQESTLGQTFLISRTDYDHDTETVSISLGGRPDNLGLWLARLQGGLPD